jgi:hypothetical protein
MSTVEAVVINWRRPQNVARILRRFREQSHPCAVTVVECGGPGYALEPSARDLADHVYTLNRNYGGYNRYVPLGSYHATYTYFHDDDMLPGRRLIEHFVRHAGASPHAGALGQDGRSVGAVYSPSPVARDAAALTLVDMLVRGYFVRTEHLHAVHRFRLPLGHAVREDDMILAWALRTFTEAGTFLTPEGAGGDDERMNEEELPAPHAQHRDPEHVPGRTAFWHEASRLSKRLRLAAASAAHVGTR